MFSAAVCAGLVQVAVVSTLTQSDVLYNRILYSTVQYDFYVVMALKRYGPLLHPHVLRILDNNPTPDQEAGAYGFLQPTLYDCSRFLGRARVAVASPNAGVRGSALQFLSYAGDRGDVALIIPLLSDKDMFVRMGAAQALERMGNARTVLAINVWLTTSTAKFDEPFREYVREYRDRLKARLAGVPGPPMRANPYPTPTAGAP